MPASSPSSIDLVITATISPDRLMPATAARIAHECGCGHAGAYDVSAGCSGFVYALAMATGAVASGLCDHVLVVGAETISRILDWEDRSTAVLFGDGAGAVVVSAGDQSVGARGVSVRARLGARQASWASTWAATEPARSSSRSPREARGCPPRAPLWRRASTIMKMNGSEVFKFATRVMAQSAGRVLERCGRTVADVDLFVPHQANLRIIDTAVGKLGIAPEKVYTNLQRVRQHFVCLHPPVSQRSSG